ncbi:MAG TPA: methyltransferase domain-containing protein [bacterium]|nr:methyltransferase domain-containing protein [bacterium]
MIGLSVGNLLHLNAAANALIPSRTLGEMTRMAVDPEQPREFSLPVGLAVSAGVRVATSIGPSALRLVSEIRQARGRPLGETLAGLLQRVRETPPPPASLDPDLDPVLSRHPRAFRTHPMAVQVAEHFRSGRIEEARSYLRNNWCRFPAFLDPVLRDLMGDLGARALLQEEGVRILEDWKRYQAEASLRDQYPIERFGKSNLRGMADYDRDAFGREFLVRCGAKLRPQDTLFHKMIGRLPRGAHLADWGSGAGIFGHEVKSLRPDLRVTSADLFPPEEILAAHPEPPLAAETLRSEMNFLTGNAVEVGLPENDRADLLISVFLLPWVPDPLRFFAHMYNQLKPGGVMLATVHMETYDVDRPFGERMIGTALADDLRAQGLEVELANSNRTIAVRRADAREMMVTAALRASSFEELTHAFGVLYLYYNFYRRASSGPGWMTLS